MILTFSFWSALKISNLSFSRCLSSASFGKKSLSVGLVIFFVFTNTSVRWCILQISFNYFTQWMEIFIQFLNIYVVWGLKSLYGWGILRVNPLSNFYYLFSSSYICMRSVSGKYSLTHEFFTSGSFRTIFEAKKT